MNKVVQWITCVLNPVVVGVMFPIPLVQFGHVTWTTVFLGFVLYTLGWILLWKFALNDGQTLTIGGD